MKFVKPNKIAAIKKELFFALISGKKQLIS